MASTHSGPLGCAVTAVSSDLSWMPHHMPWGGWYQYYPKWQVWATSFSPRAAQECWDCLSLHVTDREIEAERGQVPCPRSHSEGVMGPGLQSQDSPFVSVWGRFYPQPGPFPSHLVSS